MPLVLSTNLDELPYRLKQSSRQSSFLFSKSAHFVVFKQEGKIDPNGSSLHLLNVSLCTKLEAKSSLGIQLLSVWHFIKINLTQPSTQFGAKNKILPLGSNRSYFEPCTDSGVGSFIGITSDK